MPARALMVTALLILLAVPALAEPVAGAAVWGGKRGALEQGLVYPLGEWRSLLGGSGRGEVVAFAGKDSGGLAVAHQFAEVAQGPNRVRVALGLGIAVPWKGPSGISGGRLVLLGVISIGGGSAK